MVLFSCQYQFYTKSSFLEPGGLLQPVPDSPCVEEGGKKRQGPKPAACPLQQPGPAGGRGPALPCGLGAARGGGG